jgi:hypothetical protein
MRGNSRVVFVNAGGAIAAFAEVEVGTNGQAVTKSAGVAVGFAVTAATSGATPRSPSTEPRGAQTMTAPVSYPLGAPTLVGNTLTVDTALKQPGRITKRIADLTLQKFIVDKIFASSGATTVAGAIIYDQARRTSSTRPRARAPDAGRRVPHRRREPHGAAGRDLGGLGWQVLRHRRGGPAQRPDPLRQPGDAAGEHPGAPGQHAGGQPDEAAITALGGAGTFVGHNWEAVVTGGSSQTNATGWPAADFANAQYLADVDELGVTYDLWIMNPLQKASLVTVYGAGLADVLASFGIDIFASNRVRPAPPTRSPRARSASSTTSRAWPRRRGARQKTKRNWVQTSVMPIMGITNPYSIKKVTGL